MKLSQFIMCSFVIFSTLAFAQKNDGVQVELQEGFQGEVLFQFESKEGILGTGVGGLGYASDGRAVVYNDGSVFVLEEGVARKVLELPDNTIFGSFLLAEKNGPTMLFGNSSNGEIIRFSLDKNSKQQSSLVDKIDFNYDAAVDGDNRVFVSANINQTQKIVLLDADPNNENFAVVDNIPGFSGPLTVDDAGNLYYATADFNVPSREVYRFSKAQIDQAILTSTSLSLGEGEFIASGFDSVGHMETAGDQLFLTDFGYGRGVGFISKVNLANLEDEVEVFAEFPIPQRVVSPTYIEFRPGMRDFLEGAGPKGGAMMAAISDFSTVNRVVQITSLEYFRRGYVNSDEQVDIADVIAILNFLFVNQSEPDSLAAVDVNDDNAKDLSDALYLLNYLFLGGTQPPAPFEAKGPDRDQP